MLSISKSTRKAWNNFNLFLLGDDHEGNTLRHDDGWGQMLGMVLSEYDGIPPNRNRVIHHGDIMECITRTDKRYSPETTKGLPLEQFKAAKYNLGPIAGNIDALLQANHDHRLDEYGRFVMELCEDLDIPFGTWSCHLNWRDSKDRLLFNTYHTHGRRMITSSADDPDRQLTNMNLTLKRQLKFKFGDCAIMCKGHTHKLLIRKPQGVLALKGGEDRILQGYTTDYIDYTAPYIHPDFRWYVNTGSFLKLFGDDTTGYAERGEYDPIELGFAVAKIRERQIVDIEKVVLK